VVGIGWAESEPQLARVAGGGWTKHPLRPGQLHNRRTRRVLRRQNGHTTRGPESARALGDVIHARARNLAPAVQRVPPEGAARRGTGRPVLRSPGPAFPHPACLQRPPSRIRSSDSVKRSNARASGRTQAEQALRIRKRRPRRVRPSITASTRPEIAARPSSIGTMRHLAGASSGWSGSSMVHACAEMRHSPSTRTRCS